MWYSPHELGHVLLLGYVLMKIFLKYLMLQAMSEVASIDNKVRLLVKSVIEPNER